MPAANRGLCKFQLCYRAVTGMNYIYLSLGYDMALVDEVASLTAPHVKLVGYREIIELAKHKHRMEDGADTVP